MAMNRRTPAALLLLAASSLTLVYAADSGRWTVTPTRQVDDHQHAPTEGGDRLDPRFGAAGIVVTAIAPGQAGDYQQGMAIQRDGKILVGGTSDLGDDAGGFQWRLTRYTRSGDLDATFGSAGTVLTSMTSEGGFDERMIALAVQHDGKIVAAGSVQLGPDSAEDASALARYHSDGALDTSFGDGGIVVVDIAPGHDFVTQVLIDDNDRILVGGGCQHSFLARYKSDGRLDQSFNADGPRPGIVITEVSPAGDEILGMAFDGRGRIVAGGVSIADENGALNVSSTLARYLPDGTLDRSFNPRGDRPGIVVTPVAPGANWDVVFEVAIDRQGRILTAGDAYVGAGKGGYDIALSRYMPDGRLDSSFGRGGIVFLNPGPGDSDDDVQGLVIQANGRILIGGSTAATAFLFDSDFMVARYMPDGSLDPSFGTGGIVTTPTGPGGADDEIWAMALQNESSLVAAGECDQPSSGRDVCLVRYKLGDASH